MKDAINETLSVIKSNEAYRVYGGEKNEKGTITLSFSGYHDSVYAFYSYMENNNLYDANYMENSKALMDSGKSVDDYSLDEIFTSITKIYRAERFSEGSIASAIESGWLESLLNRALEICDI